MQAQPQKFRFVEKLGKISTSFGQRSFDIFNNTYEIIILY